MASIESAWLSDLSSMELVQLFLVSKLMNQVDTGCLGVYSALQKIFQFKNLDLVELGKHKSRRYNSHQIQQAMIDQLHKDQEAVTSLFFHSNTRSVADDNCHSPAAEHFLENISSDEGDLIVDKDAFACTEQIGPYCVTDTFKTETEFDQHLKLWHSNYVTSDCKHCLRRFENLTVLKQHLKTCTRQPPPPNSSNSSPKPKRIRRSTLRQSISEKPSFSNIKLEPPVNFGSGEMVLDLPPLPKSPVKPILTPTKKPKPSPKNSKKCEYDGPYCRDEFQSLAALTDHKQLWHGSYIPSICERCFQRFKDMSDLKDHKTACPGHPPGYTNQDSSGIIHRRTRRTTLTEAEINEANAVGADDIVEINCSSPNDYSIPVSVIKNGPMYSGTSSEGSHGFDCACQNCRTCTICNDTFKNRTGLAIHNKKRHDLNRNSTVDFKLEPNEKIFDQMVTNKHESTCTCHDCTNCKECDGIFATKRSLKTHFTKIHGTATCGGVNPNCTCRTCCECQICHTVVASKLIRVVHMQNDHNIGGLETGHPMLCRCDACTNCPICSAVSSSQHGLKIHLAQRHNLKMVRPQYSSRARYIFKSS